MTAGCGRPWMTTFGRRSRASQTLVCIPYAGAAASLFAKWPRQLPDEIAVAAVDLPGRPPRLAEPPVADWLDLIPPLGAALQRTLEGPFVLFGHSLGALVAFEVARWLRQSGGPMPARLMLSGRRAPHLSDPNRVEIATDEQLIERVRRLNGAVPHVLAHDDLRAMLLPRLRADFTLVDNYRYTADQPLACPIAAFGGRWDEEAAGQRLHAWRQHTTGRFTSYLLDGDHFFIHACEGELLARIRLELAVPPDTRRP